jgi:hypothetical protein
MTAFVPANAALVAVQAALVALPGAAAPASAGRLRGRAWAPVGGLAVVAVVVAGAQGAALASELSRLALVAVPLLAAVALAWAVRGARPALAVLTLPLLALTFLRVDSLAGDAAAAVLSALSCVTLGRLLAAAVPGLWLKAGLVVWAVLDAISVFSHPLVSPDAVVDVAVPAPGLPQLQVLDLHASSLGYADVFVAAVLGGVLAAEGRRQWPVALLLLGLSGLFDLLFLAFSTLPATVPVAAAMLIREGVGRRPRTPPGVDRRVSARPTTSSRRWVSIGA